MTLKEEILCIFNVTTTAVTKRSVNDVLRVKIVCETTATSSKPCVQDLHASVSSVKIFRTICYLMRRKLTPKEGSDDKASNKLMAYLVAREENMQRKEAYIAQREEKLQRQVKR